jgi:transcriptional regulator with XRE-family HTH domain
VFNQSPILHTLCVADLYRLLGKNIAHFRRAANLTQEELAEKTDYSVDFISLVERGINAPTLSRLKDIAGVIGVEVWRLLFPSEWEEAGPRESTRKARLKSRGSRRGERVKPRA